VLNFYIGSDGSRAQHGENTGRGGRGDCTASHRYHTGAKASVRRHGGERFTEYDRVFTKPINLFDETRFALRSIIFDDSRAAQSAAKLACGERGRVTLRKACYWRTEQSCSSSKSGNPRMLGANGAIYAIRRPLRRPLAPKSICDEL